MPTQDLVLGLYYLTKAKVGAIGEGRVFANIEEVLMALEAKQVETLTPIRLRHTGPVLDMTVAYDDQDLLHTEAVEFLSLIHISPPATRSHWPRRSATG